MSARVLVLGAGFGELELSMILSEHLAETAEVAIVDKSDAVIFGYRGCRAKIAEERT